MLDERQFTNALNDVLKTTENLTKMTQFVFLKLKKSKITWNDFLNLLIELLEQESSKPINLELKNILDIPNIKVIPINVFKRLFNTRSTIF